MKNISFENYILDYFPGYHLKIKYYLFLHLFHMVECTIPV